MILQGTLSATLTQIRYNKTYTLFFSFLAIKNYEQTLY